MFNTVPNFSNAPLPTENAHFGRTCEELQNVGFPHRRTCTPAIKAKTAFTLLPVPPKNKEPFPFPLSRCCFLPLCSFCSRHEYKKEPLSPRPVSVCQAPSRRRPVAVSNCLKDKYFAAPSRVYPTPPPKQKRFSAPRQLCVFVQCPGFFFV